MIKKQVEGFLLERKGYLKKSPIMVAQAIWKSSPKTLAPKTGKQLLKDLDIVKGVQKNLRAAETVADTIHDTNIKLLYDQIIHVKERPKRTLFFDIEVSPNIVFSWRLGSMVSLTHDNLISERAIICICYKWKHEDKVHSLEWKNGNDKDLLIKFAKVIDSADEVVTQNGDSFDVKWLRARCAHHSIPISPKYNSIDTLKMARSGFKFNSNKLDYMGQFLGVGGKIKTDFDLWRDIVLDNNKQALNQMVTYCKRDVKLLEEVYSKLQPYCPPKNFKYKR